MMSQRTGVDGPPAASVHGRQVAEDSRALFRTWIESPVRPKNNIIMVDSTGSPETLRDHILKQIMKKVDHVG